MSLMGMYNKKFTVTRTEVTKNTVSHVAEKKPVTYGPYPCCIMKCSGNYISSQPMGKLIQNLKLSTIASADVKSGDIIDIDGTKYIVENPYKPRNHHLECDITQKSEV